MALEKKIKTKYGIDLNYWRVVSGSEILYGVDEGKTNYILAGWKNAEDRIAGYEPLQRVNVTLSQNYKDDWQGLYTEVKTTEVNDVIIFEGATDAL